MSKYDIEGLTTQILLSAKAAKTVSGAFSEKFTTERDPENLAEAVRHHPQEFIWLFYVIEDYLDQLSDFAEELDALLGQLPA